MSSGDVKYFRIGKVDEFARIVGMWELEAGKLPYDHIKYFYDEKGRVIRFEKYERDLPGAPYRTYNYEGDSHSVKDSMWYDRYGKLKGIHRYYCNEKGFMVKREETHGDGSIKYYILSEYDEYDRLVSEAWHNPDHTPEHKDVFIYDNPDIPALTPSSEEKYDSNNELEGIFYYGWDEKNNLIEKKWCNKNNELKSYYQYKYNEMALLVSLALYLEDNTLQMSQEFEYDELGNKISEKIFDGNGHLIKHNKWSSAVTK